MWDVRVGVVVCASIALSGCLFSGDDDSDGAGSGDGDSDAATGGSLAGTGGTSATGGSDQTGSGGTQPLDPTDPYAQARVDCVDRINGFRATEGLPPLERWVEAESCTDEQSELDFSDRPHANFEMCGEWAQNTCPDWGSVERIIQGCLQSMWDEGPGENFDEHGHYLNMSSTEFTRVACGFYEMPNGDIWHNHNFQ